MLFIVVGLITLFASFLIAIVMLIRELSQRVSSDDTINDFSLDLADEVIPEESRTFDSVNMSQVQQMNALPKEDPVSSPPSLDEVVPFPWVMEVDNQFKDQVEQGGQQETERVSNEPVQGLNLKNLNDVFVSDLVNKD